MHMRSRSAIRGFSLVELMVALLVGLVVTGAVLAFVVAIIRSNNQTISATRLTQELRATTSVISGDLKRATGVDDPLTAVKLGNPYALIDDLTPGCLKYAYANAPDGNFRAISWTAGGPIKMDAAATAADAACGDGEALSSDAVVIDSLSFNVAGRRIDVAVSGHLKSDPEISRTYRQTVFVRSVGG